MPRLPVVFRSSPAVAAALVAALSFPALAQTSYAATMLPTTDSLRTEAARTSIRRPVLRRFAFRLDTLAVPDCATSVRPYTDSLRAEANRALRPRATVIRRYAAKIDTLAAACGTPAPDPSPTPRTLARTPAALTFSADSGAAAPAAQLVTLTNSATGEAAIVGLARSISYTSGAGWLAATFDSTTTPTALRVTATPWSLASGSYAATLTVTGDSVSSVTVGVTLTVNAIAQAPDTTPPTPAPTGTVQGAELPRSTPTWSPALADAACTDTVTANLQATLNAVTGTTDRVLCLSGTFSGSYTVPANTGTGWLVLRSLARGLTSAGARARPSQVAGYADLQATLGGSGSALIIRRSKVIVSELDIGLAPALATTLTAIVEVLGSATDVVIDRSYIHAGSSQQVQRCVSLQNAGTAIVVNSWLDECHGQGFDAQAIAGWSGTGPYLIENNYLAGSGENVMFGGAMPSPNNTNPSDITIRRNHFHTPAAWRGVWTKKVLFELKAGVRVLAEGNVFDGSWRDGQTGFAFMFYSTNPGNAGCTGCRVTDVVLRANLIKHVAGGINLSGAQTVVDSVTRRLAIVANVIDSLTYASGDNGRLVQVLANGRDLVVDSLLAVGGGGTVNQALVLDPNPAWTGLTWTNSVSQVGTYGVFCSRFTPGDACLQNSVGGTKTYSGLTLLGASRSGYSLFSFATSESTVPLAAAIRARVAAATAGVVVQP